VNNIASSAGTDGRNVAELLSRAAAISAFCSGVRVNAVSLFHTGSKQPI
jgi:hypothetical protein